MYMNMYIHTHTHMCVYIVFLFYLNTEFFEGKIIFYAHMLSGFLNWGIFPADSSLLNVYPFLRLQWTWLTVEYLLCFPVLRQLIKIDVFLPVTIW